MVQAQGCGYPPLIVQQQSTNAVPLWLAGFGRGTCGSMVRSLKSVVDALVCLAHVLLGAEYADVADYVAA